MPGNVKHHAWQNLIIAEQSREYAALLRKRDFLNLEIVTASGPNEAGATAAVNFPEDVVRIFCENCQRFLQGQPLRYTVDFYKGY